jgi:hypothetical protein
MTSSLRFRWPYRCEPTIAFSSYGRRLPKLHEAINNFCSKRKLHYDFSVSDSLNKSVESLENYQIYSWHLRHSWFNIGWSVETTNPDRAADFSPMTCRWFEAAASGSIVLGDAPRDPAMEQCFGKRFVIPVNPNDSVPTLEEQLDDLWKQRHQLREQRLELAQSHLTRWTWEGRIRDLDRKFCWYRNETG